MKQLQSLIKFIYTIQVIVLYLLVLVLYWSILGWLELGLLMILFILGGAIYEYHRCNQISWFTSVKDLAVLLSGILFSSIIVSIPIHIEETDYLVERLFFLIIGLLFYFAWVFLLGSEHIKEQVSFWRKYFWLAYHWLRCDVPELRRGIANFAILGVLTEQHTVKQGISRLNLDKMPRSLTCDP